MNNRTLESSDEAIQCFNIDGCLRGKRSTTFLIHKSVCEGKKSGNDGDFRYSVLFRKVWLNDLHFLELNLGLYICAMINIDKCLLGEP